ncbi:MAG: putative ABC transport system permease protein [Phenylobacterium sp.]|jgi:putative ABC transport system permease protein
MIITRDLKQTLASLAQAKSFAISVILTMAITMGALVSTFNLNYQLLEAPLPYPDEDKLYVVEGNLLKKNKVIVDNALSMPSAIEIYHEKYQYFQQQALFTFNQDIIRSLADTPLVKTGYASHQYLQMLQTPMALGRFFNSSEGINSHAAVAVISYNTWQTIYANSADILQQSIRFGEVDFKIIGVTGADFIEPQIKRKSEQTQVWLPWDFNIESKNMRGAWNGMVREHGLLIKFDPAMALKKAQLELTSQYNARFKQAMADQPFFAEHSISFELQKLRTAIVGDNKDLAMFMFAGAFAVLLIACANIINLILSRAVFKQRTFAIHAVLGAQKFDLFWQLFLEILVLMLTASGLSLIVAFGGFELLKTISSESLPRLSELSINLQSVLFALVCALVLTVLIATLVSNQINYRALNSVLKSSGKGTGIQISGRVRQLLIVGQVALTGVVLVLSLQLFIQSSAHILKPLDFNSEQLTQITLNTGLKGASSTAEIQTDMKAVRDSLVNHPNIEAASIAHDFPISSYGQLPAFSGWSIHADKTNRHRSAWIGTDEHFLKILGIDLIAGRIFSDEDVVSQNNVVVISEALAKKLKPNGNMLNEKIYWASSPYQKDPFEVIGIIKSFTLLNDEPLPYVFVPRLGSRYPKFLLQFNGSQQPNSAEINKLMAQVSNQYKVSEQMTMQQAHSVLVAKDTLTAWLTATLAIFSFALSAIGLYGVLSYNVQIRQYELGIRMAIGARPITIFGQMLKDNLMPATVGLAIALAIYAVLWRWGSFSEYLSVIDPLSWLLAVMLILLLTAFTTLASVWNIISKRVVVALRGS